MRFVDDSELRETSASLKSGLLLRFSEEMETKRPVIQIMVSFYSWTSETWFSFLHPSTNWHPFLYSIILR